MWSHRLVKRLKISRNAFIGMRYRSSAWVVNDPFCSFFVTSCCNLLEFATRFFLIRFSSPDKALIAEFRKRNLKSFLLWELIVSLKIAFRFQKNPVKYNFFSEDRKKKKEATDNLFQIIFTFFFFFQWRMDFRLFFRHPKFFQVIFGDKIFFEFYNATIPNMLNLRFVWVYLKHH